MTALHSGLVSVVILAAAASVLRSAIRRARTDDLRTNLAALRAATRVSKELFIGRAQMWDEARRSAAEP
jgi:hypothetical protein